VKVKVEKDAAQHAWHLKKQLKSQLHRETARQNKERKTDIVLINTTTAIAWSRTMIVMLQYLLKELLFMKDVAWLVKYKRVYLSQL